MFSVGTGTYTYTFNTAVTNSTPGATVRYTTDGNEPTESGRCRFRGLGGDRPSLTLKAKAFKAGLAASNTDSAVYTLVVPAPGPSPGGPLPDTPQTVTVSCGVSGTVVRTR